MIKKRIKKIIHISVLIGVRQIWKLLENIYRIIREPFLTLKNLIKIKDKSQIFLLSLVTILPILGYISARVIWDLHTYGFLKKSVGMVFGVAITIEVIIFSYLFYWIKKVISKN